MTATVSTPQMQIQAPPAGWTGTGPLRPAGPRTDAEIRRAELASFLRSRRERITPEQVGLPRGRRRRTPGLRREEVAQLAAVGVTWYTWLEQARDIRVSTQVLDAIAKGLLLDRAERSHLFALAGEAEPRGGKECTGIPDALRQVLDQLSPFPAVIQNSRFDLLAYNATYGRLLCDLDALPEEDRNCLWLAFTNEEWRARLVDLDVVVRTMAAKFRAAMADHVAEHDWKSLLARLTDASPEFREIWARHEVVQPVSRTKVFRHPQVGIVQFAVASLWTGPNRGPRLLTYTPVDDATRERLEALARLE
ncbi:helix-turn-helix transcriptional regulator [Streptomyces sp. NPDC050161]|uniref:helix-turn-helix transcriptional regulator n=1 Tax=Streptomyces sp. NPDC050161 TaxID=3365604 RepID=UPI0037A84C86